MTNNERIGALRMRLQGKTWEYIGEDLGYSPQNVRADLISAINSPPKEPRCAYPAILKALNDKYDGSVKALAEACNISPSAMYYTMRGAAEPTEERKKIIAKAVGLSSEEAFQREE